MRRHQSKSRQQLSFRTLELLLLLLLLLLSKQNMKTTYTEYVYTIIVIQHEHILRTRRRSYKHGPVLLPGNLMAEQEAAGDELPLGLGWEETLRTRLYVVPVLRRINTIYW